MEYPKDDRRAIRLKLEHRFLSGYLDGLDDALNGDFSERHREKLEATYDETYSKFKQTSNELAELGFERYRIK